ncbi:hypothetical protein L6452_10355 [Arctium lappa]|uniref:Uncharacterized protein n=1 Tax=Arctium lappa TaxID=4217 RepID=A0ACB9DMI3_ARCLA|nr:hypothetical protein L6452_10355 [Arctium lappa]
MDGGRSVSTNCSRSRMNSHMNELKVLGLITDEKADEVAASVRQEGIQIGKRSTKIFMKVKLGLGSPASRTRLLAQSQRQLLTRVGCGMARHH